VQKDERISTDSLPDERQLQAIAHLGSLDVESARVERSRVTVPHRSGSLRTRAGRELIA